MLPRFFSEQPIGEGEVLLGGEEAHHLIHVLRAKPGQRVVLFDGLGGEYEAQIVQIGRSEVRVHSGAHSLVEREERVSVVMVVSLPKGDRQKWLVEKLTELGAAELIPLRTERGVAQPTGNACQRLEKHVIAASKQCGRNRLMRIGQPLGLEEAFQRAGQTGAVVWIAHPRDPVGHSSSFVAPVGHSSSFVSDGTQSVPTTMDGTQSVPTTLGPSFVSPPLPLPNPAHWILIGPEGGFTDQEFSLAMDAGTRPLDLGPRILRIETAAVAALCRLLGTN